MLLYSAFFFLFSVMLLLIIALVRHLKLTTMSVVFAAGCLSGPIAGLIEHFLEKSFLIGVREDAFNVRSLLLYILIVGPVEEIVKFTAAFLPGLRRLDFQNTTGGMVLAISASLGFAAGENVLYMLALGPEATLPRLILGNAGHASYGIFWGYALGAALHERAEMSIVLQGLLFASVLHGLYDYLLTLSLAGAVGALLLSLVLLVFMISFLGREIRRNKSDWKKTAGHKTDR